MQLDVLIAYFFCYAVVGYLVEVIYCSFPQHRFVNRGFLHGPYLPIYGFGALYVVFLAGNLKAYPILVFLVTFFGTSALEYVTHWILERLFNVKLWYYSSYRYNLNGRVCLLNSTLFGLLGLGVIYGLHPLLSVFIERLDSVLLDYLSTAIVLVLGIDTTTSIVRMAAFQRQIGDFKAKLRELEERVTLLAKLAENTSFEQLRAKLVNEIDELKSKLNTASRKILDAFPSITSANEEKKLLLENLKQNAKEWREVRMKMKRRGGSNDARG